ncbi:hypothetical protein BC833DRAFT_584336 [Globomyces pollinis-pini]|nr:hypothetical protein BC833DRAFT_584336 [Globomyces pollinis-pini]
MSISNVVRDRLARILTSRYEPKRQALRLIIYKKENPLVLRIKAQMELQKLSRYTRPVAITPRCIQGGRTRNIIMPFKLSPIAFRERALNGDLPGVKKSIW